MNVFNLLDERNTMPRQKIDSGNTTHDPNTVTTFLPTPRSVQIRNTFAF